MTKYSRTKKYAELRNKLQNDSESDIKSVALNSYVDHLTNSGSSRSQSDTAYNHDPIHQRREDFYQTNEKTDFSLKNVDHNYNSENNDQNDYLKEYLNEVRQYNIDQGNAISENTEVDILRKIRGQSAPLPTKPFTDESEVNNKNLTSELFGTSTTKIPFFDHKKSPELDYSEFAQQPVNSNEDISQTQMTKADIAAEVQNLIREQITQPQSMSEITDSFDIPIQKHFEEDRTTRQQLLNETTQMRAQLDDYEENLNDVSEKMQHTNTVLNIVLIVLIIALLAMLCVVGYWILSSRGIV